MEIDPKDFSTDRFVPLSAKIDELQRRVRELEHWAYDVTRRLNSMGEAQWLPSTLDGSDPEPEGTVCDNPNCRCTPDR
jgi:hypothetical protein